MAESWITPGQALPEIKTAWRTFRWFRSKIAEKDSRISVNYSRLLASRRSGTGGASPGEQRRDSGSGETVKGKRARILRLFDPKNRTVLNRCAPFPMKSPVIGHPSSGEGTNHHFQSIENGSDKAQRFSIFRSERYRGQWFPILLRAATYPEGDTRKWCPVKAK